jgi:hypothetical protein
MLEVYRAAADLQRRFSAVDGGVITQSRVVIRTA